MLALGQSANVQRRHLETNHHFLYMKRELDPHHLGDVFACVVDVLLKVPPSDNTSKRRP